MKEPCDNQRISVQHGELTTQRKEKSFTYLKNSDIGKGYFKILLMTTMSLIYTNVIYIIHFCRFT